MEKGEKTYFLQYVNTAKVFKMFLRKEKLVNKKIWGYIVNDV